MRSRKAAWGKAPVTVADQAVSSLTNFLPGIYAAHALGTDEFGVFALIQVGAIIVFNVVRASLSEVAMLAHDNRHLRLGAVDGAAVLGLGVAVAATTLLSVLTDAPLLAVGAAALGVAVMPLQDALRLESISNARPLHALVNDTLWLAGTVVGLGCGQLGAWPASALSLTAAWGLPAAIGAAFGAAANGWRGPRLDRALVFFRTNKEQSASFLADYAIRSGAIQVATYGVGLIGGMATVAGIRAAQLLLGPLNILFSGVALTIMPRARGIRAEDPARLPRAMRGPSLLLGGASIAAGLTIALMPAALLQILIGDQAAGLSTYALPIATSLAASGLLTGSNIGLRALGANGALVTARTVTALATIAGGAAAYVLTGSPVPCLWGLALGALVAVPLWEALLRRQAAAASYA